MRKLLLLFAVMLSTMGAWAQDWSYATNVVVGNKITDISTIEDGQLVLFKHVARGEYIVLDANADADLTSSLSGLCVFKLHKGEGENEGKFTIESSKEGYYFPTIQANGGWIEYVMSGTPVYYEFLSKQADDTSLPSGQFVVKCASTSGYFDGGTNTSSQPDFTAWEGKGNNSKYEIYAVNALYYFKDAYDMFQSGFYSVQCPNKSNVYAMFDGTRITYNGKKDNTKSVFYFEKGDGNKYTIRLSDGRYITYKGTGTGDQIEFKLPAEATDANKWWQICSGKVSGRFVIVPDQQEISNSTPGFNFAVSYKKEGDAREDSNGALGLWDCDDNNSQWVIAPSAPMFAGGKAKIKLQNIFVKRVGDNLMKGSESDFELFTITRDGVNNRYSIQTSDGTYVDNDVTLTATPEETKKWWVIRDNTGDAVGASNPVDIYPYKENVSNTDPAWNFAIEVDKVANAAVGLWNGTNNNSYCELLWEIENVLIDEAANEYNVKSYGIAGFVSPSISVAGVSGYTITSSGVWNGNVISASIDFGFPVSKDGGVTNATMIRQGSWASSVMKWHAVNGVVKAQAKDALSTDVSEWLWAIYPKYNAGAFTFNIKNVATNSYVKANAEAEGAGNQVADSNVSLDAMGTDFTITKNGDYIKLNYKNVSDVLLHLSVNSENNADQFLGVYSESHNGDNVSFLAPSYKATITDAKAATLYTPVAVTIPDGVTAKYVKAEGENMGSTGKLVYTKLNDVIPANSAVVLTGEAGDYTFTATTEAVDAVTGNVLFGYATETAATDNTGIYALANKTNGVAFYPFVGTTYKAGKAYLNIAGLSTTSEVRLFNIFDEGEETAVEDIQGAEDAADAVVYDLAGRRVQKAQKGLYIVNGKKVIK